MPTGVSPWISFVLICMTVLSAILQWLRWVPTHYHKAKNPLLFIIILTIRQGVKRNRRKQSPRNPKETLFRLPSSKGDITAWYIDIPLLSIPSLPLRQCYCYWCSYILNSGVVAIAAEPQPDELIYVKPQKSSLEDLSQAMNKPLEESTPKNLFNVHSRR